MESTGKDQPLRMKPLHSPDTDQEFSQGSLGVNQQQQLLQQPFWELHGSQASHLPRPQPAEQAEEVGGGGWAKCWSRLIGL